MTNSVEGMKNGVIRAARPADVPEILQLIADLAEYENARAANWMP